MPPWPVRFLAAGIAYWVLAPFILFDSNLIWHVIESVAFGIIAATGIPWLRGRRRRHFANPS